MKSFYNPGTEWIVHTHYNFETLLFICDFFTDIPNGLTYCRYMRINPLNILHIVDVRMTNVAAAPNFRCLGASVLRQKNNTIFHFHWISVWSRCKSMHSHYARTCFVVAMLEHDSKDGNRLQIDEKIEQKHSVMTGHM